MLLENSKKRAEMRNLLTEARKRLGALDAYKEGARRIVSRFLREGIEIP